MIKINDDISLQFLKRNKKRGQRITNSLALGKVIDKSNICFAYEFKIISKSDPYKKATKTLINNIITNESYKDKIINCISKQLTKDFYDDPQVSLPFNLYNIDNSIVISDFIKGIKYGVKIIAKNNIQLEDILVEIKNYI